MLDAIYSLFTLRWRQQPQVRPLPQHISRTLVPSPGGDLEILTCSPTDPDPEAPPIFFLHGGYGSAGVWLEWMTYLHESGYRGTTYAYSVRNHGASYAVPYFRMVYRTRFDEIVDDFRTCLDFALKTQRANGYSEDTILVGHSSGGGVSQYALSEGLVRCRALCLVGAIPHFGALPVYANWSRHDPWFPLRSIFHFQHPTSPLSSERLVHGAFFGDKFPMSETKAFKQWMPFYEAMWWPMSMMGSFMAWWRGASRWLSVQDILKNMSGHAHQPLNDRVCVMVGDQDVLMDLDMCRRQVAGYRQGLTEMKSSPSNERRAQPGAKDEQAREGVSVQNANGVRMVVVEGAGHHVQNDIQHHKAAEALLDFVRQC